MFVEVRCQLHSELAAIEEEKGFLEASLTHLQKALLLDNGTQREHLLSAVHNLQLRTALDLIPSRHEDKAAQLMQKVSVLFYSKTPAHLRRKNHSDEFKKS